MGLRGPKGKGRIRQQITLSKETRQRLEELAESTGEVMSELIERAILKTYPAQETITPPETPPDDS